MRLRSGSLLVLLVGVFLYAIATLRLNSSGLLVFQAEAVRNKILEDPSLIDQFVAGPPSSPPEVGHESDHERVSWGERRVAWLIPYVWSSETERQQLPYFAPLWAKTVAASRAVLKVFVFYEDPNMELPFRSPPPNLEFVLLERGQIIKRLARVLHQKWPDQDPQQTLKSLLDKAPKELCSYKPLFGAAFQDYIGDFSHWAWGDMDTLFGDLARLVTASDLDHFDVLSFNPGYGWYYTQGQFAIFQNTDKVINSWQGFSDWAVYESDLRIKLAPLQYEGREGSRQANVTVIWDKGRLLAHCPEAYVAAAESPAPLPREAIYKECQFQSTWASPSYMSGPWTLEKNGTLVSCKWYGPQRQPTDYDKTTQEFLFLHFNYVKEERRADNLARRTREEILDLAESATRLEWLWDPFDIVEAPPCGQPHGGYCPHPA